MENIISLGFISQDNLEDIEKEEVEMYIEEDNYFGIKSLKQAEVLFDKLRKKYQDLK